MDKFEEIPQGWIIHGDLEEKLYFLANILYFGSSNRALTSVTSKYETKITTNLRNIFSTIFSSCSRSHGRIA